MEFFWTIVPFIAIALLALQAYKYHTDKNKKEEIIAPSWVEKQPLYKYIKLVFITRVIYRQWTVIFYLSLWITFLALFITLNIYISTPAIPLNKMQISEGKVQAIYLNKKSSDKLVLETENGNKKIFATSMNEQIKEKLLGEKIKVWYFNVYRIFHFEDTIYQIYINNKPLNKHWNYSYKIHKENKKQMMHLIIKLLIGVLLSIFFLWFFNRKELPIHRLNRIKYKRRMKSK